MATASNTNAVPAGKHRYDWLHFAARAGEEGRGWAEEYRYHASVVDRSDQALDLMRRGQLEAGQAALVAYASDVAALEACPTSMRSLFDRWYHGVAGYYFYLLGEYDRAERSMDLAHQAVVAAISEAAFLVLVSIHCKEFCLHQARIARNRRRWDEMTVYIERGWAMTRGDEPLCTTEDGREVSFATIASFLGSLGPLSEGERAAVRSLTDARERLLLFDRFVRTLDRPADIAIRYP